MPEPTKKADANSWSNLLAGQVPSWTEQDAELRELWTSGQPPEKIAEKLNRSEGAVMTRAARLGLPRRAPPGRKAQSPGGAQRLPKVAGASRPRQSQALAATNLAAPPVEIVERVCLMCLTKFPSMGRQNRICGGCKEGPEYRNAMQVTEYMVSSTGGRV